MSNIRSEISTNNAMPCRIVFLVEFFLNVGSNVFLQTVFRQRCSSHFDCFLLHLITHVSVFDDRLSCSTLGTSLSDTSAVKIDRLQESRLLPQATISLSLPTVVVKEVVPLSLPLAVEGPPA